MIRPLYTYFETQTISYPDSASCVGILTEPTILFSDHHESGLSRVVVLDESLSCTRMCTCAHYLVRHAFRGSNLSVFSIRKIRCDCDGTYSVIESLFSIGVDHISRISRQCLKSLISAQTTSFSSV